MPYVETRFGPCRILTRARNRPGTLPTALLVHGSGGRAEIWSHVVDLFEKIEPVSIELPGHGESKLDLLKSVDDCAILIDEVRAALNVETAVVIGHSLGGAVAQQYGRAHPDRCKAIVIASAGPNFDIDLGRVAAIEQDWNSCIEHFARGQVSPHASPAILAKATQLVLERNPAVLANDLKVCKNFDSLAWAQEIGVPTLIVCAYEDRLTPIDGALALLRLIEGSALTVISPGGHSLMLEHPIRFARAIDAFIEEIQFEDSGQAQVST